MAKLKDLIGKTLIGVENNGDEEIVFTTTEGQRYKLYHERDCCESVAVESITGDLLDLVGDPDCRRSNQRPEPARRQA